MFIAKVSLRVGKQKYFYGENIEVQNNDIVIVEEEQDVREIGKIVKIIKCDFFGDYKPNLRKILKKADHDDFKNLEKIKEFEKEAEKVIKEKIQQYNIEMTIQEVKSYFDKSKIIFYFLAEQRVDFRELVKELGYLLKTRIELHQIGVRDEAKKLSGIGSCGYPLCCNAFLKNFEVVSIKMAKEQNLPLSPIKISGVCGRLMCCLKYEYDIYQETKERLPKENSIVLTYRGEGKVIEINVPKETLVVEFENKLKEEIHAKDVKILQKTG